MKTLNRRSFVKTSAMAATAVSLGALETLEASATVPAGRFDLSQASVALFAAPRPLLQTAAWQSFNFTVADNKVFYLSGTGAAGHTQTACGNLSLSYLLNSGSNPVNDGTVMQFNGFGHGQSLGYEKYNGEGYVWLECNAPVPANCSTASGDIFGRSICVIKWTEGTTHTTIYTMSDIGTATLPGSHMYTLVPGSTRNMPATDPVSLRLLLRFYWPGDTSHSAGTYYHTYDIADIRLNGNSATPIYAWTPEPCIPGGATACPGTPSNGSVVTTHPVQGIAIYGNYGYIISGYHWPHCTRPSSSDDGNIYIMCFNLATGNSVSQNITAYISMPYREPEGMAIEVPADGSGPRLAYGLCDAPDCPTDGTTGASDPKRMQIYYKNAIITTPL